MEIRKATIDDYDLFVRMNQEIHQMHVQAQPTIFKPSIQLSKDSFSRFMSEPQFFMNLAIQGGKCIGYVFCEIIDIPESPYSYARKSLYIRHIYIEPNQRGNGYSLQLLELAKDFAQKEKLSHIDLDVWTFNEPAHALFKKFGFASQKERMSLELNQ